MHPQPGDIRLADHGLAAKTRPVVIVSRQYPDPPLANVQGLGSLPAVRLERRIGRLSAQVMERLKDALALALDIERVPE